MDWDVLIPILMFAFPVVVALLDKRAKKRRGVPPVQSRPVFPPAANTTAAEVDRLPSRVQPVEQKMNTPAPEPVAEGQRAISRERHQEVVTEEKDPEPKLRIDKKNLILYSEILKPKFDA